MSSIVNGISCGFFLISRIQKTWNFPDLAPLAPLLECVLQQCTCLMPPRNLVTKWLIRAILSLHLSVALPLKPWELPNQPLTMSYRSVHILWNLHLAKKFLSLFLWILLLQWIIVYYRLWFHPVLDLSARYTCNRYSIYFIKKNRLSIYFIENRQI